MCHLFDIHRPISLLLPRTITIEVELLPFVLLFLFSLPPAGSESAALQIFIAKK
jgi:hypothetical protein